MVKCLTHGLRGFNGAVQRRLATLTVTMLISSCWQLSSEVELRRIFDVCKQWANSGSYEFVKKNMVRYMRPHGRFAHFYTCSAPTARFGLLYRNILFFPTSLKSLHSSHAMRARNYLFRINAEFACADILLLPRE